MNPKGLFESQAEEIISRQTGQTVGEMVAELSKAWEETSGQRLINVRQNYVDSLRSIHTKLVRLMNKKKKKVFKGPDGEPDTQFYINYSHVENMDKRVAALLELNGEKINSPGDVSDGYHTFDELYDHRMALFVNLMLDNPEISWRSKDHAEGGDPMFEGFFIVGMDLPAGQITYHYKLEHWDTFAGVKTLDHAPIYDGHTPNSVVKRLLEWASVQRPVQLMRVKTSPVKEAEIGELQVEEQTFVVNPGFEYELENPSQYQTVSITIENHDMRLKHGEGATGA